MKLTGIKWVFLDLGWTLFNEARAHLERAEKTVQFLFACGKPVTVEELLAECDRAAAVFARSPFWGALASLGLTREEQSQVQECAPYAKELEVLYPEAEETLRELASRFSLGTIANQSLGTDRRLREHGVREYFDLVLASTELGVSKPDPKLFDLARESAGCSGVEIVMVGDRLDNDILPAKTAGWHTIRVRRGFHRNQEPRNAAESPDFTVDTVAEVPALLG